MSRHPFYRDWKGLIALLGGAFLIFLVFLWTRSYVLAIGALLVAGLFTGIYLIGESSDLPGTAGDRDKDVPT